MASTRRMGQSVPQYESRPLPSGNSQKRELPSTNQTVDRVVPNGGMARHNHPATSQPSAETGRSTDVDLRTETLVRLRSAADMAARNHRSIWDFAIEISEFSQTGTHILRELICQGLVRHRREIATLSEQGIRQFAPEPELVLSERSCFVITEAGIKHLDRQASLSGDHAGSVTVNNASIGLSLAAGVTQDTVPRWDEEKRELWFGPYLVKRFRWPAPNQLAIIREFHRLNWPTRIADPLPPSDGVDAKQRLHDTIKCLNRRRINKLIKFGGDGTGTGVVFKITLEKA